MITARSFAGDRNDKHERDRYTLRVEKLNRVSITLDEGGPYRVLDWDVVEVERFTRELRAAVRLARNLDKS